MVQTAEKTAAPADIAALEAMKAEMAELMKGEMAALMEAQMRPLMAELAQAKAELAAALAKPGDTTPGAKAPLGPDPDAVAEVGDKVWFTDHRLAGQTHFVEGSRNIYLGENEHGPYPAKVTAMGAAGHVDLKVHADGGSWDEKGVTTTRASDNGRYFTIERDA